MFDLPRFLSGMVPMAIAVALVPTTAHAAPGSATTPGAAQAAVIAPLRITSISPLAFGQITRPTEAGTVVLAPNGSITTTGGVLTSTAIAQSGSRGPGTFTITGDPGRQFSLALPILALLRQGPRLMLVGFFRSNWNAGDAIGASGNYPLSVGATLRVGANQTIGIYTGTYAVTVAYQ